MELHTDENISIPALLGSPLPFPSITFFRNPVVKQSLKIWVQLRKCFGLHNLSLLSPIASNHLFKPSTQDPVFKDWHRKGLARFKDLFIDNPLASFEQLSDKFSLPKSDFFRYLQTRHFVLSKMSSSSISATTSLVDMVLSLNPSQKRLVSALYGRMLDLRHAPVDKIKAAWEKDLGLSLSEDTWSSVLKLVNSTSLCARHCLIQFKVVHRAHISTAKRSTMYPDVSPLCVKCKMSEASLIHMYWSCPGLNKFWKGVFQTLSQVFKIVLEPNPLIALFGVIKEEV